MCQACEYEVMVCMKLRFLEVRKMLMKLDESLKPKH